MGILAIAGKASAVPITFQGGEFDVSVTDLGSNVYRFIYSADFTGWDDTTNDNFITAIDFGLGGWTDIAAVTLVGTTAPGTWVADQGNGSANNCDFKDNGFKICADEDPLLLSVSTENDSIYSWTIDVTYNNIGSLDALTGENAVKAVFYQLDCKTVRDEVTCKPKQSGNMSLTTVYGPTATTTTSSSTSTTTTSGVVPEPGLLSLLGTGVVLVSLRFRRKKV